MENPSDNESTTAMKQRGFTLTELGFVAIILAILGIVALVLFPIFASTRRRPHYGAASPQNCRQIALAAIMYGSDFDDTMPITTNGWLSRIQDRKDKELTLNCPTTGTQAIAAPDAAGARRTDAWPLLLLPYIKSRGLLVQPERPDTYNIWSAPAHAISDKDYDPNGATFRNQNLFPMYGYNYMFCSPLRIPASKRMNVNATNYAESEAHTFTEADDPSGTIFFIESRAGIANPGKGFFVVNAPGMWNAFKDNNHGLVAYWTGGAGSGDWVGSGTACADAACKDQGMSTGFVSTMMNDGASPTFIDGHVKYMKSMAIAAGTDFMAASATADGGGAYITDKKHYLWNLTKDYHGL